jgi:site-specific DNA-methyltransferase (adenine-specific)
MEKNKIYLGDCLELMPKHIEDKSIDMIFCDLPYGTTKNKLDSIIDLDKLWEEYKRVIKDNGAIVLFAQTPFDKVLSVSNLDMLKYEWIWNKNRPTGYMNANYAPMKQHENILVFSKKSACYVKDKKSAMNYYPQDLKAVNKKIKRTAQNGNYDPNHYDLESVQKFTGYPKSIIEFSTETGLHPTQKPLELIEYMIKTYTNEGDLILDNTCGSGTAGRGAKNLNRDYIMMEQDERYYKIACKRLED